MADAERSGPAKRSKAFRADQTTAASENPAAPERRTAPAIVEGGGSARKIAPREMVRAEMEISLIRLAPARRLADAKRG